MSQLANNPDHARMAAAILLTLPGNLFIYYGEETGMLGVKPDEGLREPMNWPADGQGEGQTTWEQGENNNANPVANVESQLQNRGSLLEQYRQLISLRNKVPALRDGGICEYSSGNSGIMAFERITAAEQVLVVHNLTGGTLNIPLHPKERTPSLIYQ